jgi:hypothetical protein
MKAITILQPYAQLIAVGAKRYETRGWRANYRGRIAIHAGKKAVPGAPQDCSDALVSRYGFSSAEMQEGKMPLGAVIATADLVECWRVIRRNGEYAELKRSPAPSGYQPYARIGGAELLFGDWEPGRYAWELTDVEPLPRPIPAKGRQGLWEWGETEGEG